MNNELRLIKKKLQNFTALEECARCYGVTGDPTRLKICYLLCNYKELSVSQIASIVGVSVSAVSHALAKLHNVNLVKSKRDKQTIYYSISENQFVSALKKQLYLIEKEINI